jgi:class 3 adenylate cyclase
MTVSRRLVAVFAADVEGYRRLMGDMPRLPVSDHAAL